MRFSGVVKMGVPETQDILHCRCLINIVSQPAEGLSPVCPPSSVLLLPHWWGEMEVITWPFARHSSWKTSEAVLVECSLTGIRELSHPGKGLCAREFRPKGQRRSYCICFQQHPKQVDTGSAFCLPMSAATCIYSTYFSLFKINLFLPSFHIRGKHILNLEAACNLFKFSGKAPLDIELYVSKAFMCRNYNLSMNPSV